MGASVSFRAFKNVFISCVIMFIIGGTTVLGMYNLAIEESAKDSDALDGVWTSSMAYNNFTCTISLMACGLYLSHGNDELDSATPPPSRTGRIRLALLTAAISFSLFGLSGLGIIFESPLIIKVALSCLGFGFGICYLVSTELATAWLPNSPGLAIGLCQLAYGLGPVVLSDVYGRFVSSMSVVKAVHLTTMIMSIPCFASIVLVEWPEPPTLEEASKSEDDPLLSNHLPDGRPLSWKALFCLSVFWLYVIALSATQAPYALFPYFFDICNSYGVPFHLQVRCFQVISVLSSISRPLFGALCEGLKHSDESSLGSKKAIIGVLSTQLFLFLLMIPMSCFGAFVLIGGMILMLYSGSTCMAVMLAREMFGKNNSALVFGVGGSLALGLGGSFAVVMMEQLAVEVEQFVDDYSNYYWFSLGWTGVGLVAGYFLHRCIFAFEQPCTSGNLHTVVDTTKLGSENEN